MRSLQAIVLIVSASHSMAFAPRRALISGRSRCIRAQEGDGKGFDLNSAFADALKQQTGTDKPREAKKRVEAQQAATAKKQKPRNRPGTPLDLANRPSNFFRGMAERDERLDRLRADGVELERAPLIDPDDYVTWIVGILAIIAFFAAGPIYDVLDKQGYQQAVDAENWDLVRCLDSAFSNSEKLICKTKF